MGQWGARWPEIEPDHIDPAYVLWATVKLVDVDKLPDQTVVARVDLRGTETRYWMVLRKPNPELCTRPQGHVEDIIVRTCSECLVDIHLQRTTWRAAQRSGQLALEGPPHLTRGFLTWIRPSPFAGIEGS